MTERGFYIIKDSFFVDMNEPYLKGNKEENRPHYYFFKEEKSGLYWMIPLSSKVDKYKKIIEVKAIYKKRCDTLHIAKLDNGKESVFLIQDMFPVTEKYIEREYTIGSKQLFVTSEHAALKIEKKAKRVMNILKRGIKFTSTQPNIAKIIETLKENNKWIALSIKQI